MKLKTLSVGEVNNYVKKLVEKCIKENDKG